MSKVRLTGSTSGYTEITAPAVAGSNTITLPTGNGSANQLLKNGATAGSLEFASNVVIDSSGRLLVGTSSGSDNNALLKVQGNVGGSTGTGWLDVRRGSSPSTNNQIGLISFSDNSGNNFAWIEAYGDAASGASDYPGRLVFSTTADGASTPTERMRIRSDGNVGIGSVGNANIRLYTVGSNTSASSFTHYGTNSAGTQIFSVRNDGAFNTGTAALSPYNITTGVAANVFVDASGFLYRSTSSARFKTDIETLEDSYADALLDVRPVWYRSIAPGDTTHPDWGYWGFIAEEVAEIDPRLVFWKTHETQKDEDNNDIQVELEEPLAEGVQYDRFVPHLLNLIKRQSEQIEALTARVTALEAN